MPEHLLISRFSPPVSLASSLPGEVGNIFDFRGKKRRAGRSGKGRGKGARRMPEAWNNNCRIFALHHSTSIFKMTRPSFSCSLSLSLSYDSISHFLISKTRTNFYLILVPSGSGWRWLEKNIQVSKLLPDSNCQSFLQISTKISLFFKFFLKIIFN